MRLARHQHDMCGIASYAFFPIPKDSERDLPSDPPHRFYDIDAFVEPSTATAVGARQRALHIGRCAAALTTTALLLKLTLMNRDSVLGSR